MRADDHPPRLLLVCPQLSYRTGAFLQAARELGVDTLIASTGEQALVGTLDDGLRIDLNDLPNSLDRIAREAAQRPFSGVVGTDDSTVELAHRVSRRLGLRGNTPEAAIYARRKDKARERLRHSDVPVPDHQRMSLAAAITGTAPDIPFPVVVKPLALSGSQGVIRADDTLAFQAACLRIQTIVENETAGTRAIEERSQVLVEKYIPGAEIALEGMLNNGQLSVLAVFDKPEPLTGPYFEETYYITPSRLPAKLQQRVASCVSSACDAYGLTEGPVHAELRIDDHQDIYIVEVAARTIGGECARLLSFGTGASLEQLVIAQAIGFLLSFEPPEVAAGVLMIPTPKAGILRRVEGVLAAERVPCIEEVVISRREGYELVPLPEGNSYLGFMFARAPTPAQVEAALREAHGKLNIVTAPLWKAQVSWSASITAG